LEPLDRECALASHWVAVFDSISVFAAATTLAEDVKNIWKFIPTPCCVLLILVPVCVYQYYRRNPKEAGKWTSGG